MKLSRPHIPIDVRLQVAERQFAKLGLHFVIPSKNKSVRLDLILAMLFPSGSCFQLDHDPALCNRKFNKRTGKYTPDANDPDFLVYRMKEDHDIKTRVRGDGAQYSDLALRRKNKRIERNKSRPVRKIPSRPFRKATP